MAGPKLKHAGKPAPFPIAKAVTPSNSVDLPDGTANALFVTVTGNLAFKDAAGNDVTIPSVAANTQINISASRVLVTGTTATGIYALYHQV